MNDRIDEIRERRRLSTPSPWKIVEETVYGTVLVHEESDGGAIIVADNLDLATADAEFITHAPSDIEWLLQEVTYQAETARAALAGLGRYEKRLQKVEAEREALRAKIAAEIRDLEWDTQETKDFLRDGGTYDHIAGRNDDPRRPHRRRSCPVTEDWTPPAPTITVKDTFGNRNAIEATCPECGHSVETTAWTEVNPYVVGARIFSDHIEMHAP